MIPATLLTYFNGEGFVSRVTARGLWISLGYGSSENAAADAACHAAGTKRPRHTWNGEIEASSEVVEARQAGGRILRARGCVGPRLTIIVPMEPK